MVDGYRDILEYLYHKYYGRVSEHSDVTSRYWRTIGHQTVSQTESGDYVAEGHGFGSYRSRTLTNQVRCFPEKVLSSYLLRKHVCSGRLVDAGKTVLARSGHLLNHDSVKQILALDAILKTLERGESLTAQGIRSVCVIGDGYGFLSNLIKVLNPDIGVVSINLGRTLWFDVLFSERCFADVQPTLLLTDQAKEKVSWSSGSRLIFIEAEKFDLLENSPIDLFINIASMQEMDPDVVDRYFAYMRTSGSSPCYFYCCNRLSKALPDGTVTEFMRYPWTDSDSVLIDGLCPWYEGYPSSRPPFWHSFDGPVQHRFVRFK